MAARSHLSPTWRSPRQRVAATSGLLLPEVVGLALLPAARAHRRPWTYLVAGCWRVARVLFEPGGIVAVARRSACDIQSDAVTCY